LSKISTPKNGVEELDYERRKAGICVGVPGEKLRDGEAQRRKKAGWGVKVRENNYIRSRKKEGFEV